MPGRKPRPTDEKTQAEKFADMARELGVPEDEAAFEAFKRKLGEIARHKPTEARYERNCPDGDKD